MAGPAWESKEVTVKYQERNTVRLGEVGIYPADREMLEAIMEYLGCSKAEAIRSAIRIMASQLPLPKKKRA